MADQRRPGKRASNAGRKEAPSDDDSGIEDLLQKRHDILSTALPFPKLDWSEQANDTENLKRIRDYAESLANGVLDWYLHHQKSKKRLAQCLHFIIFLFVALAAVPPLLKLGIPSGIQSTCATCEWINSHAGEVALVLLGISGVAKLWDSNAGYTVDWMRFFTTAANINRELTKFRFDWDKIELESRLVLKPARSATVVDSIRTQRQVETARAFCELVLTTVDGEVAVWAADFKKRYDSVKQPGDKQ